MDSVEKIVFAIFGGIITLAIIAVIVGKNSRAPEAIQAGGSFISNIVAAAVNPVNTASTNGNLGLNTFSSMGK
jgi:flavin reductase (DIM6/NTAB) family NADH-FMN oxidoreductase RutF